MEIGSNAHNKSVVCTFDVKLWKIVHFMMNHHFSCVCSSRVFLVVCFANIRTFGKKMLFLTMHRCFTIFSFFLKCDRVHGSDHQHERLGTWELPWYVKKMKKKFTLYCQIINFLESFDMEGTYGYD